MPQICLLYKILIIIDLTAATLISYYYIRYGYLASENLKFNKIGENECRYSPCSSFIAADNLTCYNLFSEHYFSNSSEKCGLFAIRLQCCFDRNHSYNNDKETICILIIVGSLVLINQGVRKWKQHYDIRNQKK